VGGGRPRPSEVAHVEATRLVSNVLQGMMNSNGKLYSNPAEVVRSPTVKGNWKYPPNWSASQENLRHPSVVKLQGAAIRNGPNGKSVGNGEVSGRTLSKENLSMQENSASSHENKATRGDLALRTNGTAREYKTSLSNGALQEFGRCYNTKQSHLDPRVKSLQSPTSEEYGLARRWQSPVSRLKGFGGGGPRNRDTTDPVIVQSKSNQSLFNANNSSEGRDKVVRGRATDFKSGKFTSRNVQALLSPTDVKEAVVPCFKLGGPKSWCMDREMTEASSSLRTAAQKKLNSISNIDVSLSSFAGSPTGSGVFPKSHAGASATGGAASLHSLSTAADKSNGVKQRPRSSIDGGKGIAPSCAIDKPVYVSQMRINICRQPEKGAQGNIAVVHRFASPTENLSLPLSNQTTKSRKTISGEAVKNIRKHLDGPASKQINLSDGHTAGKQVSDGKQVTPSKWEPKQPDLKRPEAASLPLEDWQTRNAAALIVSPTKTFADRMALVELNFPSSKDATSSLDTRGVGSAGSPVASAGKLMSSVGKLISTSSGKNTTASSCPRVFSPTRDHPAATPPPSAPNVENLSFAIENATNGVGLQSGRQNSRGIAPELNGALRGGSLENNGACPANVIDCKGIYFLEDFTFMTEIIWVFF